MKNIFHIRNLILLLIFSPLALIFQNCGGDINIASQEVLPQAPAIPQVRMNSQLCPISEESTSFRGKVIFIVDMSLSNVGGRNPTQVCDFSHIPPSSGWIHSLSEEGAFDRSGLRFNALEQLMPLITNQTARNVSIIGFHDTAVFGNSWENCSSDLLNGPEALSSVQGLRAMQNHDLNYVPRCIKSPNPPFMLKGTKYASALGCLRQKIEFDLLAGTNNERSFYSIVFLTDGQPEDASENNFPQMLQNLFNEVRSDILGMKLFPVYYGPTGGEEQQNALAVLNPMAQIFDANAQTSVISNLDQLQETLANDLRSTSRIHYSLKNFHAINLTALNRKGQIFLDSDMDGTPDSEEEASNTNHLRSIFNQFSASPNADKDVLPSFVEVIRGLNPDIADYSLDRDGDGVSNGVEIRSGQDPHSKESLFPLPPNYRTRLLVREDRMNLCEAGQSRFIFEVQQIATVQSSLGFTDPSPANEIDFSYSAGENLVMLYFIAEPTNAVDAKSKMFMALVRVPAGSEASFVVQEEDFKFLGEF